jgi:hypothetical protein
MLRRLVLLFVLGSELKAQELVSSYHHYSAEGHLGDSAPWFPFGSG